MKSKRHTEIEETIKKSLSQNKVNSLLNKLQFDFEVKNKNELANYIAILMTLVEYGDFEIANNILLRKIINNPEQYSTIVNNPNETFEIIKNNAIFPFVGISNTIGSLIIDLIDGKEDIKNLKNKIPEKEILIDINIEFLKKYFMEFKNNIDYNHYIRLLYNCIDDVKKPNREVMLSKKATLFFKDKIINNEMFLEDYLHHFLRVGGIKYSLPTLSSNQIVPEPCFDQIFGNINSLIDILNLKNSEISKDILMFLQIYKSNPKVYLDDFKPSKNLHANLSKNQL